MRRAVLATLILIAVTAALPASALAQFDNPSRAFHQQTPFPLEGRHLTVPCESCHLKGVYKGTPNTCFACHWTRRQDDRYVLRLGAQCEQCHRPTTWTAARWNHAAATGVPLSPAHQAIGCDTCHKSGNFRAAGVTCATCHRKDYDATREPNHAAAGFPAQCELCHKPSDTTFRQTRFQHDPYFPLTGSHSTVSCASCHKNNVYKGTPRDCAGCHRTDFDRTQNPSHVAAGFPTTCETCHRPTDPTWRGASPTGFNHSAFFPLVGQHSTQTCQACHKNSVYKGTPRDCVGCHRANFDTAAAPNHVQAGFPTTCEQCHRPTDPSWRGATFNHTQVFALVGQHATQACATCHKNNVYKGTPRDCVGCHRPRYDQTTRPNHAGTGFSTTCDTCHRPTDATWDQGRFTHARFLVTGPHLRTCAECHLNQNNYREFSCTVCHDRTKMDDTHKSRNGYRYDSPTCLSCHPNGRKG